MFLILRMGWRNLLRNRRRTFLTSLILALGLACLIFVDALGLGMMDAMVATATGTWTGEAQVHREGFRTSGRVEQVVAAPDQVEAALFADPGVEAFTSRILSTAMATSPADVQSVMLAGVDPLGEEGVSRLRAAVVEGSYLEGPGDGGVLLGTRLAKTLQVGLGDRVVLTCARPNGGDLVQEMFRVKGLVFFNSAPLDRGFAFIGKERAQSMLALGNAVHEFAVQFKDGDGRGAAPSALLASLSESGNEALDWTGLFPELKAMVEMSGFSMLIMAVLLGAAVALSILNTLFMSLYERMFEFGVLRALGTRAFRLFLLVVAEAASLGLLAALFGMAIGAGLQAWISQVGINYSGIEMVGVTMREALFPRARLLQYTAFPLGVWFFTVLISFYPAWHAARIVPAKALHRSLG